MTPRTVNDEKFLSLVATAPLVSIDLIIRSEHRRVLLGKRTNRPAKGFWFVPGGSIRKNERIAGALERISETELGQRLKFKEARFLGVFEHLYEDNFLGADDVDTHYVVLAYECRLDSSVPIRLDGQHSEARWWDVDELLESEAVHEKTKAYFIND
ncbi:MAG: GDP-mannose mannosyl hydrolase [Gammaproteobacteria bacterium]|nr:GDP-mannose mannosyl hydrolase [Gammaproteobacteria bacterium]